MTMPNSRKSRPVSPPMNITGMNTAASASVVATMAKKISRVPSTPACTGGLPASIFA